MTTGTQEKSTTEEFDPAAFDTENLPTDPNQLADYLGNLGTGESGESKPGAAPEGGKPEDTQEGAAGSDTAAGGEGKDKPQPGEAPASGEDKPQGIATRDGKHVIPYAVLESARQREQEAQRRAEEATRQAEEAKRLADEAQTRLRELEVSRDRGGEGGADKGASNDMVAKLEAANAAMARLAEDTPELAEAFSPLVEANLASIKQIQQLTQEVQDLRARNEDDDARERTTKQDEVQQAIDRNPHLRYWRDQDQEMFNRAAAIDKVLREDSANADLSFDERFTKVVKLTQAAYGEVELPEKYRPQGKAQEKPAEEKKPADSSGDIQARAEAKLKEAGVKPLTLSDLPGGAPPVSGDKRLEDMRLSEIDQRVNAMLDKGMSIQDILQQYGS